MYYISTSRSGKYFVAEVHTLDSGVQEIINIVATNAPALFWPEGYTLSVENSFLREQSGVIEYIFTETNWGKS